MTELQSALREARIAKGRSLRDLAADAGISHRSIHVLETKRRPTLETLQRIAAALGYDLVLVPRDGEATE